MALYLEKVPNLTILDKKVDLGIEVCYNNAVVIFALADPCRKEDYEIEKKRLTAPKQLTCLADIQHGLNNDNAHRCGRVI